MSDLIASWSKDPSSKIGCVAVNRECKVLSTGYNGFPKGIEDHPERYEDRTIKYRLVLHAEQNMILNAVSIGINLKDAIVFVSNIPPCERCALELIQAGISTVVVRQIDIVNQRKRYAEDKEKQNNWLDSWRFALSILDEAGVDIVIIPEK